MTGKCYGFGAGGSINEDLIGSCFFAFVDLIDKPSKRSSKSLLLLLLLFAKGFMGFIVLGLLKMLLF